MSMHWREDIAPGCRKLFLINPDTQFMNRAHLVVSLEPREVTYVELWYDLERPLIGWKPIEGNPRDVEECKAYVWALVRLETP